MGHTHKQEGTADFLSPQDCNHDTLCVHLCLSAAVVKFFFFLCCIFLPAALNSLDLEASISQNLTVLTLLSTRVNHRHKFHKQNELGGWIEREMVSVINVSPPWNGTAVYVWRAGSK